MRIGAVLARRGALPEPVPPLPYRLAVHPACTVANARAQNERAFASGEKARHRAGRWASVLSSASGRTSSPRLPCSTHSLSTWETAHSASTGRIPPG